MGYLLEELTWQQGKEAFHDASAVIVSTGSIEQHGPHLPVGTDFLSAQAIERGISEISSVVVAPTVLIGYADYHANFYETLSLTEDTLARVYEAIYSYFVSYGVTHVFLSNAHGGNQGPLMNMMSSLRDQGVMAATISWFEIASFPNPKWALFGHGDYTETSVVLAINDNLVDLDRSHVPARKHMSDSMVLDDVHDCRFKNAPVHIALRTKDYTDSGDMIEYGLFPEADHSIPPTAASARMGKEIIEAIARYTSDFVTEFCKVQLPL
jgi:creatinine amidohydrolase/Fe(II)-dependent formamide hydrolase-like protein